jgi:hypothetical protein
VAVHHDVIGLDVGVGDLESAEALGCARDLSEDSLDRHSRQKATVRDPGEQTFGVVLHDNDHDVVDIENIFASSNVRVTDALDNADLAIEVRNRNNWLTLRSYRETECLNSHCSAFLYFERSVHYYSNV